MVVVGTDCLPATDHLISERHLLVLLMWCYAIKSFWQREEVSDRSSSTGSKGIQIRSAWQRRHAADRFARNDRSPATSHWIWPATLDAGIRKVCENAPGLINKLFTCLDTDDDELVTRWQQEHVIYDFNYSRLISHPHPQETVPMNFASTLVFWFCVSVP